jgi:hypothetical protein
MKRAGIPNNFVYGYCFLEDFADRSAPTVLDGLKVLRQALDRVHDSSVIVFVIS